MLKLNRSFLLAYERSIYGETLEGRNRSSGGINRLVNWFGNRREGSIFGDIIRKLCCQSSSHSLKNVRNNDLTHWFKKMERDDSGDTIGQLIGRGHNSGGMTPGSHIRQSDCIHSQLRLLITSAIKDARL
jgi:hypothetical protein